MLRLVCFYWTFLLSESTFLRSTTSDPWNTLPWNERRKYYKLPNEQTVIRSMQGQRAWVEERENEWKLETNGQDTTGSAVGMTGRHLGYNVVVNVRRGIGRDRMWGIRGRLGCGGKNSRRFSNRVVEFTKKNIRYFHLKSINRFFPPSGYFWTVPARLPVIRDKFIRWENK